MRNRFPLLCIALLAWPSASRAAASVSASDPQVSVVATESGRGAAASAAIRIRASRAVLWRLLTSCKEALRIVPDLLECEVRRSAADGSWQQIRQVVAYSWYLPRVSYVVQATYREPERIEFGEMAGDLAVLRGSWVLRRDGDATVATYAFEVVPRFWIPGWVIRLELRRDLPRMLRALRERAERGAPAAAAR